MKNLKSIPFERNRYFYGKLLSVDDFETEQRYMNDKRRTINRFLFGTGVACGLSVVEADEESITVERGLALDFAGREIVIDEPVIKRISDLEGYEEDFVKEQDTGYYYLCLEYMEEPAQLVHNVTGAMEKSAGEYNKYKEKYRLFLSQMEPERQVLSATQFYEESKTVYVGQGVKIRQILPKYIEMGSDVTLKVEIENIGQQQEISFEYELMLSFFTHKDETTVKISFDEKEHAKNKKYVLEIPLKAACVNDVKAEAALALGSFVLRLGDKEYSTVEHCASQAQLGSQRSYEVIKENYYKSAMDYIVGNTFQQSIYLAKIYVVKASGVCLIERIEPLPFNQSIQHTEITTAMIQKLVDDIERLKGTEGRKEERKTDLGQPKELPPKMAYGEVEFNLEASRNGQILYSEEINHGLGFGQTTIVLGYEVNNELLNNGVTVFGDPMVFEERNEGVDITLGAKLNASEGSFVIGMKVLKNEGAEKVKVHWTAIQDRTSRPEKQKKKHIFIQPDIPNLCTGESIVFTVIQEGFQDERLNWSVKDLDGGTIDKNGKYTAPETAGVYQIVVSSTAYPEIKATTFVVVRDKEKEQ